MKLGISLNTQCNKHVFNELKRKAEHLNPFQLGIPLQVWNRIRQGGDWTVIELGTGVLNTAFTGDQYGDTWFYNLNGIEVTKPTSYKISFESSGWYISDICNIQEQHAHWYDAFQRIQSYLTSKTTQEVTHTPSNNPFEFCPPPFPWHLARRLEFTLPAECFQLDAESFIRNKPSDENQRFAQMALLTTFINLEQKEKQNLAYLWQYISNNWNF